MTPYLGAIQWGLQLAVAGIVALFQWGNHQKKKVAELELAALKLELAQRETEIKTLQQDLSGVKQTIQATRERTDKMEGVVQKLNEDFKLTMEAINRAASRMETIADRMVTRDDLRLIMQVQQGMN